MKTNFLRSKVLRPFLCLCMTLAAGCSSSWVDSSEPPLRPVVSALQVAPIPPAVPAASTGMEAVLKLARSGVGEDVMAAYLQRSPETYHPTAEDIVLLNDLGVSQRVMALLFKPPGTRDWSPADGIATPAIPQTPAVARPVVTPAPALPETNQVTEVTIPPVPSVEQTPVAAAPVVVVQQTVVETPPVQLELPQQQITVVRSFWPSLEPFGTWIQMRDYGWCWRPTIAMSVSGWRPYADGGRWIYSDHGWYWLSDYSWGWATFHYGRWFLDSSQGWCWLPDSVWSPAWVSWRRSSDYCGWAPLPPLGRHYSRSSFASLHTTDFGIHASFYSYVPMHRLCDDDWRSHRLAGASFDVIHGRSSSLNRFRQHRDGVINEGLPQNQFVEAAGGGPKRVEVRSMERGARPEQLQSDCGQLVVYRPQPGHLPLTPSAADIDTARKMEQASQTVRAGERASGGKTAKRPADISNGGQMQRPGTPAVASGGTTAAQNGTALSAFTTGAGVPIYQNGGFVPADRKRDEPSKPGNKLRDPSGGRAPDADAIARGGNDAARVAVPNVRPLTPPQPLTSVPSALGVDTRPLSPPAPITSVPQALGVDARPFTPPQPVTVITAEPRAEIYQPRSSGRYEPSRQTPPQETPRWEQTARSQFETTPQQPAWERNANQQLQRQFPQPAPSTFPRPGASTFPRPSPSQPAQASPPLAAPRPAAPAAPAVAPPAARPGAGNTPLKRGETRR